MFCACVAIFVLLHMLILCVVLSVYNLDRFNFSLSYVLLCLVGILISCACCIAKPINCKNPAWYEKICVEISNFQPQQKQTTDVEKSTTTATPSRLRMIRQAAPTFQMLGPAMQMMHTVWKGMAWAAEAIDDDEASHSCHAYLDPAGLSTIHESSHVDVTNANWFTSSPVLPGSSCKLSETNLLLHKIDKKACLEQQKNGKKSDVNRRNHHVIAAEIEKSSLMSLDKDYRHTNNGVPNVCSDGCSCDIEYSMVPFRKVSPSYGSAHTTTTELINVEHGLEFDTVGESDGLEHVTYDTCLTDTVSHSHMLITIDEISDTLEQDDTIYL